MTAIFLLMQRPPAAPMDAMPVDGEASVPSDASGQSFGVAYHPIFVNGHCLTFF